MVMGRKSYEKVLSFPCEWPYKGKYVVLLSKTKTLPLEHVDETYNGENPDTFLQNLHAEKGINRIYIDGGQTIRHFLEADLVDEMTLAYIPMTLGKGIRLFPDWCEQMAAKDTFWHLQACKHTEETSVIQLQYVRLTQPSPSPDNNDVSESNDA